MSPHRFTVEDVPCLYVPVDTNPRAHCEGFPAVTAYASVNDNLVRRLGLPRIQIPKRPLEGVAATRISEVTYFSIDIEGHT